MTPSPDSLTEERLDEIAAFPIAGHDQVSNLMVPYVSIGKHDLDELVRGYRSRRALPALSGEMREDTDAEVEAACEAYRAAEMKTYAIAPWSECTDEKWRYRIFMRAALKAAAALRPSASPQGRAQPDPNCAHVWSKARHICWKCRGEMQMASASPQGDQPSSLEELALRWLSGAYHGSESDAARFTRYNMAVAYAAGRERGLSEPIPTRPEPSPQGDEEDDRNEQIKAMIARFDEKVKTWTPQQALDYLVELGTHDADGNLTPEYGGPERIKAQGGE